MRARPIEVDPKREEEELREYLGESFRLDLLQNYQATLDREYERVGDEQRFYRTSEGYLYNLTVFAMSGTKTPYLRTLTEHVPAGSRILDYGCGIGSDGLILAEAGYRVEFADFDNPSVDYLRWRLAKRGIEAEIHDLDVGVPSGYDAAIAFDVIEHVEQPYAMLEAMEKRAQTVMVNFLEPEPGDQALHHDLPVSELVDHAATRRLLSYKVLHGRSHLVLYESRSATLPRSVLQRAAVRLKRARAKRR